MESSTSRLLETVLFSRETALDDKFKILGFPLQFFTADFLLGIKTLIYELVIPKCQQKPVSNGTDRVTILTVNPAV